MTWAALAVGVSGPFDKKRRSQKGREDVKMLTFILIT
jgi:hypothetical protein